MKVTKEHIPPLSIFSGLADIAQAALAVAVSIVSHNAPDCSGLPFTISELIAMGFDYLDDEDSLQEFVRALYHKEHQSHSDPVYKSLLGGFENCVLYSACKSANMALVPLPKEYVVDFIEQMKDEELVKRFVAISREYRPTRYTFDGIRNLQTLVFIAVLQLNKVQVDMEKVDACVDFMRAFMAQTMRVPSCAETATLLGENQACAAVASILRDNLQLSPIARKKLPKTEIWWANKTLSL
jgi:hypothetical protein